MNPAPQCELCQRADVEVVPVVLSLAGYRSWSIRACKPHADVLRDALIECARWLIEQNGADSVRVIR